MDLSVTDVPWCNVNNAKTLKLQYLMFRKMRASGGPPDRTRVVHHETDELFIHGHTFPVGEIASLV